VSRELPPPLPPEQRTVGQLVAETIRLYREHPFAALALGLAPAALDAAAAVLSRTAEFVLIPVAGALLLTPAFIGASLLASGARPPRDAMAAAYAAGALIWLPFPLLAVVFVLPGLAWLALVGLAVPAAVIEDLRLRAAFRRGFELARADYVHVLGSLATLAIVVFLARTGLSFLLRGFGETTELAAAVIGDLVISPLLFLGGALLYYDQAARAVDSRPLNPQGPPGSAKHFLGKRQRRSDADVHPAVEPDRSGGPDAEVESRTAPRGEP
jgi:hypothetical protein